MTRKIDYFFSMGSPWAYLGLEPFLALAKSHGASIEPHAIPLIEENGGIYSRDRPQTRRAYWLNDLRRWAKLRNVALEFDGRQDLADPTPAGDLIVAAFLENRDWAALALALHHAFWTRAEDIGRPDVRRRIAAAAGFDGEALEASARSETLVARRRRSYETAKAAGVFGVPSYLSGNELFWGQDSLPFLQRHLEGETLVA